MKFMLKYMIYYAVFKVIFMRIEQLIYFAEVVRCQSISAAAENLYIQQSTLSHSIKSLEAELGVKLFVRKNNGVMLSEDGVNLFPIMERMLFDYDYLLNYTANEFKNNKLFISISPQASSLFSQFIYQPLKAHFSNTQFHIRDCFPADFFNSFKKNQTDIALAFCKASSVPSKKQLAASEDLEFEELFSSNTAVILNKNHALAKHDVIHSDMLLELPKLLTDGNMRSGPLLTDTIKDNLSRYKKVDTFSNYQTIFNILCSNTSAYTTLPTIAVKNELVFLNGTLVDRPLISEESTDSIAYLLYRKNIDQDILRFCIQLLKELPNHTSSKKGCLT